MAVQTPSYWKEEKYQPLVEVNTAYGNKVEIPKRLLHTWRMWEEMRGEYPYDIERAKADGFFKKRFRNRDKQDIKRVYYEQYHE